MLEWTNRLPKTFLCLCFKKSDLFCSQSALFHASVMVSFPAGYFWHRLELFFNGFPFWDFFYSSFWCSRGTEEQIVWIKCVFPKPLLSLGFTQRCLESEYTYFHSAHRKLLGHPKLLWSPFVDWSQKHPSLRPSLRPECKCHGFTPIFSSTIKLLSLLLCASEKSPAVIEREMAGPRSHRAHPRAC